MPGLLCLLPILGLLSATGGAAVDAPHTDGVKTPVEGSGGNLARSSVSEAASDRPEDTGEGSGGGDRFPRSVPDYSAQQDSLDYNGASDSGPEDTGSRSRRRYRDREAATPWHLAAQVAKRVERGRAAQGYYRPEEEEVKLVQNSLSQAAAGAASTMLARQQRNGRRYDVPQIECPRSPDHMERFACPKPDRRGRFRCIDDRALCDGFYDCPDKEDENPDHCLFYKTTKAHLDILAEALLRWARGR